MNRRELIGLTVSGAALAASRTTFAQPRTSPPVVGFIGASPAMWAPWTKAFVERMEALGWVDGKTIKFEFRWTQGRPELNTQHANELVQRGVDVLWTGGAALPAVTRATSTVPVVFVVNDALATGAVKSLARPGGNATGMSIQTADIAHKRYELLLEVAPQVRRLAIMADANNDQATYEMKQVEGLAAKAGIEPLALPIRRAEDIAPAFERASAAKADALYVVINELLNANRLLIVNSAQEAKLPAVYGTQDWVRSGGLVSYGPSFPAIWARSADITDKVLRGTKPADIPVEQPTRFEAVVNLKTAKAMGLNIPSAFLVRVDDVIE